MRSSLSYSLARIALFLACLLAFWLAGLRDPLILLLVAATVSMLLSLFFLRRMRERFSDDVAHAVAARTDRKTRRRRAAADEVSEDGEIATDAEAGGFIGDDPRRRRP